MAQAQAAGEPGGPGAASKRSNAEPGAPLSLQQVQEGNHRVAQAPGAVRSACPVRGGGASVQQGAETARQRAAVTLRTVKEQVGLLALP